MWIAQGNIWDFYKQNQNMAICVTTNGIVTKYNKLVMGAGIAKDARDRFKGIDFKLGELVKKYGNIPFYLDDIGIITFPTKHDYRFNSNIELIKNSAKIIKLMVESGTFETIYSPWPGCGNGGLSKDFVRPILEEIWDSDDFVIVEQ